MINLPSRNKVASCSFPKRVGFHTIRANIINMTHNISTNLLRTKTVRILGGSFSKVMLLSVSSSSCRTLLITSDISAVSCLLRLHRSSIISAVSSLLRHHLIRIIPSSCSSSSCRRCVELRHNGSFLMLLRYVSVKRSP